MERKILNFKEAQEFLGVGRNTLLNLVNGNDFPSFKIGNKWYVDKGKIQDWVNVQIENKEVL